MCKILSEAVNAVMAVETGGSERGSMSRCKCRINLTMTRRAGVDIKSRHVVSVTVGALERIILSFELVRVKEKSRQLMRVLPALQHGQRRVEPMMFGVAVAALRAGVNLHHPPVFSINIAQLRRDIRMANDTTVIHAVGFPRRGMAGGTFFYFRVRSNTANHLSLDCIERARAEHHTAAHEAISRDGKNRDERGDETSSRQATQAGSTH